MKNLKIIITAIFMATILSNGFSQTRDVRPIPPEKLAIYKRTGDAKDRGRALLEKNKIEEAIREFREAIAIEKEIERRYGDFNSVGHYELAKALTLAKRNEEALAAYKQAFRWSPKRQDLEHNGPPLIHLAMDYALLLHRCGKVEEAKAIYYFFLCRGWSDDGHHEPFPFLVVFDPDPTMMVWDYTPERFLAAVTMARAPYMNAERFSYAETARQMEPSWIVPAVYLWPWDSKTRGKAGYDLAVNLARTDEEKEWMRMYLPVFSAGEDDWKLLRKGIARQLTQIGVAKLNATPVLQQAKVDLAKNYHKVARD